jgi:nucleoside-diphosphate-sugar epimerase
MEFPESIIAPNERVLVTGATGFIGRRVVAQLVARGVRNIRCLGRRGSALAALEASSRRGGGATIEVVQGNLLSREDCQSAVRGVSLIYHLAAGRGVKSFPDAFKNSVVTTRNLLEACRGLGDLTRFVNVSSLSVYSNRNNIEPVVLDERCPVDSESHLRGEAYAYAKAKQDALTIDLCTRYGIPFVIVRPGVVLGPGNEGIPGRVGVGTFGLFLHLGGSNLVPFTYVDNCADAIVLAGLTVGVDGEVFNVVDDVTASSRRFLKLYKKSVRPFASVYVPPALAYALCWCWENYSAWSQWQLPPVFNRRVWHVYWKKTKYSNAKAKRLLNWAPRIPEDEALRLYFDACRRGAPNA